MPFAGSGYKFYRNVRDYGAVGDGKTDDTQAINRAVVDGDRCGKNCDSTTIKGGLVYFPPGTYLISTPIIQYYYTQFVGDPNNRPVIKGSSDFTGIALIDTDVYIPEGSGAEWWINQNNFYRQIRNFVFDMMDMTGTNWDAGQQYAATGIHWQVAQATSLQNLEFNMSVSNSEGSATAVGIYMENGSGGFVGDLVFNGGNIGFRAGTQQFTATNLKFTNCLTAVSTVWNWGFTWKNMEVTDCYIAIDCTSAGGLDDQGTGSIAIIGESSMAVGSYFGDQNNPKVMVQVGEPGDKGVLEISDMLFTVKGAVAGTILMEWRVHESTQGSAGMWDSHFRVGGAKGSDLQHDNCPAETEGTTKTYCVAASMLLHITSQSSGYFENVWAWVADHDLDPNAPGLPTLGGQISIYSGGGVLIESQGPVWMYGTASEHSVLYQYQLSGARNVYMGHMQTESPYFQTRPAAPEPITLGHFANDPTFSDCDTSSKTCAMSWGVRILNSLDILIYSAGIYSWYDDYSQVCVPLESCQDRIFQTEFTERLWIFNLFTKGAVEAMSPGGGYTTEISAWLELSAMGSEIGDTGSGNGERGVVYIDPSVWEAAEPEVQCQPPCTLVMPPLSLDTETTISFPLYTTSIKQTYVQTRTSDIFGTTTTIIRHSIDTIPTTITIPPVTTDKINVWRQTFTSGEVDPKVIEQTSSIDLPLITMTVYVTEIVYPGGQTSTTLAPITSTVTLPPYPWSQTTKDPVLNTRPTSWYKGDAFPTCTSGCGQKCKLFCSGPCLFCLPHGGSSGEGGGGADDDDDDEECSTQTASSCSTQCVGASCTTSCATKTACSAKGTNTAATALIAPAYFMTVEQW
ncbi:pectin lyase-like protein, partial [Aureobasidium namibiae CBS 147.97]